MTTGANGSSDQSFKDHFSGHSSSYAAFRPTYPDALFAFLADCCTRRRLAWDCATGNGQAARALTEYFQRVVATDASEAQIRAAQRPPGIEFRVAKAEASGLETADADLITVAQALHWFDMPRFYSEVRRVLVPGGVLAVWCYATCVVESRCDALIGELHAEIVGPYWPPERKIVEDGYRDIELPVTPITTPGFAMEIDWTAAEMLGYLRTWSACQRYMKDKATDPVSLIEEGLVDAWGEGRRSVSWPLNIRVGRVV